MESISYPELVELIDTFQREALHLEMRDSYGTAAEIPHLAKWESGEDDDLEWLEPWFEKVRIATRAGKVFRRARVVSEPVSSYHRWILRDSARFVAAGEDIRWAPRRLVSTVALPGNDFWLFDDRVVVFLVFAGDGRVMERQRSADPDVVALCREAFDEVWRLAVPDSEYQSG